MAKMTFTDGRVVIFVDGCKCGLTGGCDLCKPYSYKEHPHSTKSTPDPVTFVWINPNG